MSSSSQPTRSLSEVHASIDTANKGNKWRRLFAFLGPAYLVSVGYMDPGNWATDLAGGSQFGYALIWVLLMSNLMALLLQNLSSRLGIVRGLDLAQANRATFSRPVNFMLYLLAEIAIAATDLAEVLGMAIGIQLLTGMPLIWGVSITVVDTFLLLYLQKLGMRKMEAFIITLVAFIAICFLIQIIMAEPHPAEVVKGFVPSLPNDEALYIAIGIIGATVMPHNLYLHSALVQTRKIEKTPKGIKQALKFNFIDTALALNVAFLVNAAILVLAAAVFFKNGAHVAEIKDAYKLLPGFLGDTAPILFALALIAAGQSSTVTGTLAGQIVMEGYLNLRLNPIVRRLITRLIAIIPAIIVILIYGEEEVNALLVMSQVVLSLQLGYAIIPLIHFVSDKKTMGAFAIKPIVQVAAWIIASVLVFLNLKMLINEALPVFEQPNWIPKALLLAAGLFFGGILLYISFYPLLKRNRSRQASTAPPIHQKVEALEFNEHISFKKIAIALDFSSNDGKLLSYAMAQGGSKSNYILIHIVESALAKISGQETSDLETAHDRLQLENYAAQLQQKGFTAGAHLGFRNRVKEIVRIVNEQEADMLVMGAHGHSGIKDILYGETVNAVRHELKIPILIVNL